MESWLAFWNTANRIYVNQRHREAHYDRIFASIEPLLPARPAVVLDWGCGDALAAERMAKVCGTVLLYDGAPAVRVRLQERWRDYPSIRILDDADLDALPPQSVDFVVVISVIQYLGQRQLTAALASFHRALKRGGAVLLGDVIEPKTPIWRDAINLLRFGWREGFFVPALLGMLSTSVSPYRRLRRNLGFACYTAAEIGNRLGAQGFSARMLSANVAPSRHRRSFIGRKIEEAETHSPQN